MSDRGAATLGTSDAGTGMDALPERVTVVTVVPAGSGAVP